VPAELEQRPAKTIGRYALFAEIASGGMASVHVGRLLNRRSRFEIESAIRIMDQQEFC
jgi:hypothetical protein